MSTYEEVWKVKKALDKKRPRFIQQDAHKKKRLGKKWRKARGLQSKVRLEKKGYRRRVKEGYRSPKETRNKTEKGKEIVKVNNFTLLSSLDPAIHALVLQKVGVKKKIALLKEIIAKKFDVVNLKEPEQYITSQDEKHKKKSAQKKEKTEKKEKEQKKLEDKTKEELEKKEKDSEKTEEKEAVEEEKKKQEKKEKDKILTKKV